MSKYAVMVNVLVQCMVYVDADSQNGAAEIAKDTIELAVEENLCNKEIECSIIQNNVIWTTEAENI